MSTLDGTDSAPLSGIHESILREAHARHDQRVAEAAKEAERERWRRAEIEKVVSEFSPPEALRPGERADWIADVVALAEALVPYRPSIAANLTGVDFGGLNDPTGSTWLVVRAGRIADLQQTLNNLIERQEKAAVDYVRWSTPPSHSSRARNPVEFPVARPEITDAFTEDDLRDLSSAVLRARIGEAEERTFQLEAEVYYDLRFHGLGGLGSGRSPLVGGLITPVRASQSTRRSRRTNVNRLPSPKIDDAEYERPRPGRFPYQVQFLHELGWIISQMKVKSEYPSSPNVRDWFGRYSVPAGASEKSLKGAARHWFGGWPAACKAAMAHFSACTDGPSCAPPGVLSEVPKGTES